MKKLDFVVTGTGKCGTVYMAKLLTELGFSCGHEAIFTNKGLNEAKKRLKYEKEIKFSECTNNISKWTSPTDIVADASYMSAPFLDWHHLKETKIIHVVRNPVNVISSFIQGGYFDKTWPRITISFQKFIQKHMPIVYDNDLDNVNRCALYYVEWNKMIEKKLKNIFLFHKIENSLEKIYYFLGRTPCNKIDISKKINSWQPTKKIKIEHLAYCVRQDVLEIIEKYKYNYRIL